MSTTTESKAAGLHASLSSYELSRRSQAASSSSSHHSPTSLRSRSSELFLRRPRPFSSKSYEQRSKEGIRVQVIERSAARISTIKDENSSSTPRRTRSINLPEPHGTIDPSASVPLTVKKGDDGQERKPPSFSAADADELGQQHSSTKNARLSRPSWVRTRSGGVWYRSQRRISSQENSSTRSVRSLLRKPELIEPKTISVSPLKPPPRAKRPVSEPVYHITVETTFEKSKQSVDASDPGSLKPAGDGQRRRFSTEAKKLFSAPLVVFRRAPKPEKRQQSPTPMHSEVTRTLEPKDHKTLLKRDQTGAMLERASSLLEACKLTTAKSRLRAWTYKSASTTSSSDVNDPKQERVKSSSPTFNLFKKEAPEHVAETTSSILDMQMGSTPRNSATDVATYKVKRSPSAETEEFLKIDISVRGGTSYLPSEARRIHTPPLPEPGQTGFRRGFFFDYNAPNSEHLSCGHVASGATSHLKKPNLHITKRASGGEDTSKHATKKLAVAVKSPSALTPLYPITADWHGMKVAEIDSKASETDVTTTANNLGKLHSCKRNQCQANMVEMKRREYEAQVDYDTPEHLPTSPLCPRNPRYWRVIKNKGSKFRGC